MTRELNKKDVTDIAILISEIDAAAGEALPDDVRIQMESFFRADFGQVRTHILPELKHYGCRAMAGGGQIFFAPGAYSPGTNVGRELIGHELAHLLQQHERRCTTQGVQIDAALEEEADRKGWLAARHIPNAITATRKQIRQEAVTALQPALYLSGEWKDNPPGDLHGLVEIEKYVRTTVKPFAETKLFTKITGLVKQAGIGATDPNIRRVLHNYLVSPGGKKGEKDRIDYAMINLEFSFASWKELADEVVYVLKSESKRDLELELALVVTRSSLAKTSVDKAVDYVNKVLNNLHEGHIKDGVKQMDEALKTKDAEEIKNAKQNLELWNELHSRLIKKLETQEYVEGAKLYHSFLPEQPTLKTLLANAELRSFEESVALLHDLLELTYGVFKNMKDTPNPLQRKVTVTTGAGGRRKIRNPRSKDQTSASIEYAKSLGMPTEMGPSYTTVRFCSINNLRKAWVGDGQKPSQMTIGELKHLVWSIFAYWSLYYRKAFAGAHCYFAINDAARSVGCALSYGPDYPEWTALNLELKPLGKWNDVDDLEGAKKNVRAGVEAGGFERVKNHRFS